MPSPLFLFGLLLTVFTGYYNIGIIGLDDYLFVIDRVLPAQLADYDKIVSDAFWSPALPLLLAGLGKLALWLGLDHPVSQLRFLLMVWGAVVFSVTAWTAGRFFEGRRRDLALFLTGFFFLSPLVFSRPMIETAAAPLILLSAFFACRYFPSGNLGALIGSVVALSAASVFRFQVGVCIVVPAVLVLMRRRAKEMFAFITACLVCFALTGWLDSAFSGKFHGTLFNYVRYNLNIAEGHGVQPFYVFLMLFILLSIPPTFFSRYRGFEAKEAFRPLFPAVGYFIVFLVIHTLIPHKEERFMIPILPLFFVLLVPLADFLFVQRWRVVYFLAVNAVLLPVVVFTIPQANVIQLVRHLDNHPEWTKVLGVGDTLVLFPAVYGANVPPKEEIGFDLDRIRSSASTEVIAIRKDLLPKLPELESIAQRIAEFPPDLIESLFVRLNPKHNTRRDTILLFKR